MSAASAASAAGSVGVAGSAGGSAGGAVATSAAGSAGLNPGTLEQGPIDQGFSDIEDLLHEFREAACWCCTDRKGGRRTVDDAELEVEDRSGAVASRRLRPPPRKGFVPPEDDIHGRIDPEVEDRSGAVAPRRLRPPPRQGFVPPEDDIHERIKRLRWRAPPGAPMAGSGSESE